MPIGLLSAVYLNEYRTSRSRESFGSSATAEVPSIIIGIFGYAVLVMPMGFSGWAGAFALGVMMIPIVMRSSEESLKLVPGSLRNASYALGAAAWQTAVRVIVPAALPAIVTGVFLAIARIAGETAPLLLTANNSNFWPRSPGERMPYLTYYIYTYSRSDEPSEQRLAWSAALVLLMFVMLLNVGIRSLTGRRAVSRESSGLTPRGHPPLVPAREPASIGNMFWRFFGLCGLLTVISLGLMLALLAQYAPLHVFLLAAAGAAAGDGAVPTSVAIASHPSKRCRS